MRKLLVAPLLAVALIVALLAANTAMGASASVSVKDNFFSPKSKSVKKGTTVKWTWAGRAPHNVTFRTVHSSTKTRGSYSLKFNRAGSFSYRCTIHSGMTGTIKVS